MMLLSLEMRTALRSSFYDVGLESRAPTERRHGIMLSSEEMPLLLLLLLFFLPKDSVIISVPSVGRTDGALLTNGMANFCNGNCPLTRFRYAAATRPEVISSFQTIPSCHRRDFLRGKPCSHFRKDREGLLPAPSSSLLVLLLLRRHTAPACG